MSARIQVGDKFFRIRRGKLVKIPDEWVGNITTRQTIRKRKEAAKGKNSRHGMRSVQNSQ